MSTSIKYKQWVKIQEVPGSTTKSVEEKKPLLILYQGQEFVGCQIVSSVC